MSLTKADAPISRPRAAGTPVGGRFENFVEDAGLNVFVPVAVNSWNRDEGETDAASRGVVGSHSR
jgi:hypothetical protein